MAAPISTAGPSHLPSCPFGLGYAASESYHITQSYKPCSSKRDLSAVCPETMVSGTWPYNSWLSKAVCDHRRDPNSNNGPKAWIVLVALPFSC